MEKKKLTLKDSSLSFIGSFLISQIMIIFLLLFSYVICLLAGIDSSKITDFLDHNCYGYLIKSIFFMGGILLTFFLFNRKKDNKTIQKPSIKKMFLYILIGILGFFMLVPIVNCFNALLLHWGVKLSEFPYELNVASYFMSIISLVIIPAVIEELLMRGTILKGMKGYGQAFTIIMTAIMFAMFHMSIEQMLFPILMGLLLSVIMYHEDNIIYSIIVHAVSNFLSVTMTYLRVPLFINHWAYILLAFLLLIAFLSIVLYFTFKGNKTSKHLTASKIDILYFIVPIIIMIIFWIIINLNR